MNEKVTYVSALSYVLENCNLPSDVADKIATLKAQTEKRNSAERKPTAKQKASAEASAQIAGAIREILGSADAPMTVADIISVGGLDASTQKVSAVLKAMGAEIVRTVEKRKAHYSLAK